MVRPSGEEAWEEGAPGSLRRHRHGHAATLRVDEGLVARAIALEGAAVPTADAI